MILYHGSSVGILSELKPFLSEHGKPYLYFSSNPVIALLYTVKPVPKPFSFYPYGFDKDGTVEYSEYWVNAFSELYKGKSGFLYQCDLETEENPTGINGVYVTETPVEPLSCMEIPDIYEELMTYGEKGLFRVKAKEFVSKREMDLVYEDICLTIQNHNLKELPENPMSLWIKQHFAEIWRTAVTL